MNSEFNSRVRLKKITAFQLIFVTFAPASVFKRKTRKSKNPIMLLNNTAYDFQSF